MAKSWGRAMRSLTTRWWRSLSTSSAVALVSVVVWGFSVVPACAQQQRNPYNVGDSPDDIRDIPRRAADTLDKANQRNAPNAVGDQGRTAEKEPACLLPPLTLMSAPTVAAEQLQKTARARSEYQQGCTALRKKKNAEAEKHFRKAVHEYRKYATAWVTLGQVLQTEKQTDEARDACSQALVAEPKYAPAYLCLADIAARAHAWAETLKLSGRALELDPSGNAIAYEYHATAHLNLHNLAAAEKDALRAAEIDRDHREPRLHFVLAQIYEAEGDASNEAAQLREYLKYCDSAPDAAMVEQYLAELERSRTGVAAGDSAEGTGVVGSPRLSMQDWGPPDIDAGVPPVLGNGGCPLAQILKEATKRTLDLIDNMDRFSASERIEQIDIDRNGKRHTSTVEILNYVAQIEEKLSAYPRIREYRAGGTGDRRATLVDFGTAAFALIFHPNRVGNFDFRCEGLTELQGSPAWQVHFVEGRDPNQAFSAIRTGKSLHLIRFKGRAWITTDSYNVLRIETDLVAPIAEIDLRREHQVITYTPVEFPRRNIRLWLPESSSLYVAYRGHHYERVHTFLDFQLFSVESAEAVKEPVNKVFPFF